MKSNDKNLWRQQQTVEAYNIHSSAPKISELFSLQAVTQPVHLFNSERPPNLRATIPHANGPMTDILSCSGALGRRPMAQKPKSYAPKPCSPIACPDP